METVLVTLLIVVIILGVIWMIAEKVPLAQPFRDWALIIIGLIAIIYLISLLPGVSVKLG